MDTPPAPTRSTSVRIVVVELAHLYRRVPPGAEAPRSLLSAVRSETPMKIARFSLESPDSEGAMSAEAQIYIENRTNETIRMCTTTAIALNPQGFPVASSCDDQEPCFIEPDEDHCLPINIGSISADLAGHDRHAVILVVTATLHARECFTLGEANAPQSALGWTTIERAVTSQSIESPLRVLVRREDDTDDGTAKLEWRVALRNIAKFHIESAELMCELLDCEDSLLESSQTAVSIDAGAVSIVEDSFWSVESSRLEGARLKFRLAVLRPVQSATSRAQSSPAEE
jgi:hypothetical protein